MDWSREFDIIVIGSGGSGMMAASRAAHEGANDPLTQRSNRSELYYFPRRCAHLRRPYKPWAMYSYSVVHRHQ